MQENLRKSFAWALGAGALAVASLPAHAETWSPRQGALQTDIHLSALPMLELGPSRITPVARQREELLPADPAPRVAPAPEVYGEETILAALRVGDAAFSRCRQRAQRVEPLAAHKARLELEVDERGRVRSVTTDLPGGALPSCVTAVSRLLPLPATGRPGSLRLLILL